jgi:hypothetical protein
MVDAREYLEEYSGIAAGDVDRERRAVLVLSHWRLLSNTRRSLIVLPLEMLVEVNKLRRCYLDSRFFGIHCGA